MSLTPEQQRRLEELRAKGPPVMTDVPPAAFKTKAEEGVETAANTRGMAGTFQPIIGGRPQPLAPSSPAGAATDIGMEAGAAATGQMVGSAVGPIGTVAGGMVGGAAGNTMAQVRRMSAGEQDKFRFGEAAGAALGGALPGGSLVKAGATKVSKEAIKAAAGNISAISAETLLDKGRYPTMSEMMLATGGALTGTGLARAIDGGLNRTAVATAVKKRQESVRRETLNLGKELGYVIPPSMVRPSYANDLLGSVGGSAATMREAIERNQPMTNKAVRKELELPDDMPLDEKAMNTAKAGPFAVYGEVANTSDQSAMLLDAYKKRQAEANMLFKQYRDMYPKDPKVQEAAKATEEKADELIAMLDKELKDAGKEDLMSRFSAARVKLAKIGTVESALNYSTGDVDAAVLGRIWDTDRKRMTGELAKVGRFYNAFSQVVKDAAFTMPAGVTQTAPLGSTRAAATQDPNILLTLFGAPRMARDIQLSKPYQRALVNPDYGAVPPDMSAAIARFGGQSAGRAVTRPAPVTKEEPAKETPPPPAEPKKTVQVPTFEEGRIYKDPDTGVRKRYKNGKFIPV